MVPLKDNLRSKNSFLPSATVALSAGATGNGGKPSGTESADGGVTAARDTGKFGITKETIAANQAGALI